MCDSAPDTVIMLKSLSAWCALCEKAFVYCPTCKKCVDDHQPGTCPKAVRVECGPGLNPAPALLELYRQFCTEFQMIEDDEYLPSGTLRSFWDRWREFIQAYYAWWARADTSDPKFLRFDESCNFVQKLCLVRNYIRKRLPADMSIERADAVFMTPEALIRSRSMLAGRDLSKACISTQTPPPTAAAATIHREVYIITRERRIKKDGKIVKTETNTVYYDEKEAMAELKKSESVGHGGLRFPTLTVGIIHESAPAADHKLANPSSSTGSAPSKVYVVLHGEDHEGSHIVNEEAYQDEETAEAMLKSSMANYRGNWHPTTRSIWRSRVNTLEVMELLVKGPEVVVLNNGRQKPKKEEKKKRKNPSKGASAKRRKKIAEKE